MAAYRPIVAATDLPNEGDAETSVLDFKVTVLGKDGKVTDHVELAKDVAAFANADGGTLVIGACEDRAKGTLDRFIPLTDEAAKAVREGFSNAVAQRCSPNPLHDSISLPKEGGFVVAVNVSPSAGQVIGVRVAAPADAYVFPRRVGIQTVYLRAEQLPMFMVPEIRRIAILLRSMSPGDPILASRMTPAGPAHDERLTFVAVDEVSNGLVVAGGGIPNPKVSDHMVYPLDRIESVWKATDGWHLVYRVWR